MSDLEAFQQDIETFLAERGMNPTQFGKQFAGDPRFVFDIRNGRETRSVTRKKIREAMEAFALAPAPEQAAQGEAA